MIENIKIQNEASYGDSGETLSGLSKFNFIYGSNGTGKTTISRVIADESIFSQSLLGWQGGISLEPLVYNRDFVEKNFSQSSELKGIFTLGENDKDYLDKIKDAKELLDSLKKDGLKLKNTLGGEDGDSGKKSELEKIEAEFEGKCWKLKSKYDEKFQGAFSGVRGSRFKFKNKLLSEAGNNLAELKSIDELENRAKTIFGESPLAEKNISVPNYESLLSLESDPILKKRIIGKEDVDIAAMIKKLGNSDWVSQGREFYDANDDVCPFCQQKMEASFADSLNAYFNEAYKKDMVAIDTLLTNYKTNGGRIQQSLQLILDNPPKFIDADKLKVEKDVLDSKISGNLHKIEKKQVESSLCAELDSLENVLAEIKVIINSANNAINEHNKMVSNLSQEKRALADQIWKFFLDEEIKDDLTEYFSKTKGLNKSIESLESQIKEKRIEYKKQGVKIKKLEKNTTSIQPTIDDINSLLENFGFSGFSLAKSEKDRFYKIQRPDGSDAQETLSEGEKSFVTFLYFYHLLKGSESESGMTTDRVVVFDDPVSSLDSDILFIVSSLIRGLFEELKNNQGHIKQIFVLTHNVYFHKEITYRIEKYGNPTFWSVTKPNQRSKIIQHDTNPIKTSYELLWIEVQNTNRSNLSIQNTLRRILENYFKILGGIDPDDICDYFSGKDKLICKSLFSWVNDGSHSSHDDLYVSADDSTIDHYLKVFKKIFHETNHDAHYDMMMNKVS